MNWVFLLGKCPGVIQNLIWWPLHASSILMCKSTNVIPTFIKLSLKQGSKITFSRTSSCGLVLQEVHQSANIFTSLWNQTKNYNFRIQ
jgi:hypothetical protein